MPSKFQPFSLLAPYTGFMLLSIRDTPFQKYRISSLSLDHTTTAPQEKPRAPDKQPTKALSLSQPSRRCAVPTTSSTTWRPSTTRGAGSSAARPSTSVPTARSRTTRRASSAVTYSPARRNSGPSGISSRPWTGSHRPRYPGSIGRGRRRPSCRPAPWPWPWAPRDRSPCCPSCCRPRSPAGAEAGRPCSRGIRT